MLTHLTLFLVLTISNCDTGVELFRSVREWDHFAVGGNRVMECITYGVKVAKPLAEQWRKEYPNASANVTCQWRLGSEV